VIVILAREADAAARSLAARWGDAAAFLCCADIAQGNTAIAQPRITDSTLTLSGRPQPISSIAGVLNLLPAVIPTEINFYAPEERAYQAAEFHALLLYLLAALPCPVINRPTTLSLNGPVFNALGWYHLASRAGIPLAPLATEHDRLIPTFGSLDPDLIEVAILGGRIVRASETRADTYLTALANEASVHYLAARFWRRQASDIRFVAANCVPDPAAVWLEPELRRVFTT
jgi:hypothetical protein